VIDVKASGRPVEGGADVDGNRVGRALDKRRREIGQQTVESW
jgi:hypothetical protein